MTEYFDHLEVRHPDVREKELFNKLPGLITEAKNKSTGWAEHLKDVHPNDVTTRAALAALPLLRKSDIAEKQKCHPPLGGFSTSKPEGMGRLFMSPGFIYEPEGRGEDWWRTARALFAAGFRKGDIIHNAFSYHLTPGGFILDTGARALGCAVIPAGVGQTDGQLQVITHFKPDGYCGTPDFLKILLDKASEEGLDISSIKKALVSGAALPPTLRDEFKQRSITVLQAYITADLGLIAYETDTMDGMIVDESVLVEIVRPGTGELVNDGEVGEVLVTSFNPDYPMIRFATGDLSAVLPGTSPCGRTNMRIKGWMGRADQTTKVKGQFIHPSQIADVAKLHSEVSYYRLVIKRENEQDIMTLEVESSQSDQKTVSNLSQSLQNITGLRGEVVTYPKGTLPRDGIIILDRR